MTETTEVRRRPGAQALSPRDSSIGLAARQGARAAPFGAVLGALLGFAGGGADRALTSSETSLVMAAVLGFGLMPAMAAAFSVARQVRLRRRGTLARWFAAIGSAALAGMAWGGIGALMTYAVGSVVGLNLNLPGLGATAVGAGLIGGGAAGVLAVLAASIAPSPRIEASADCPG